MTVDRTRDTPPRKRPPYPPEPQTGISKQLSRPIGSDDEDSQNRSASTWRVAGLLLDYKPYLARSCSALVRQAAASSGNPVEAALADRLS